MAQTLSSRFEARLAPLVRDARANDVLALSDFYLAHPGESTPWDKPYARMAYLSYFLPLNYARMSRVFHELERFIPTEAIQELWDFGSGPGTTGWVLEDAERLNPHRVVALERAREAMRVHEELMAQTPCRFRPEFNARVAPGPGALAVFSYSFLEMQNALPRLEAFDHLLIVEPSTMDCARRLMAWREPLWKLGFNLLAPCTHENACPLLVHSERDWCHMRVEFEGPAWWQALEDELPMKNRTLTYSYLLASRRVHDERWRNPIARVIGDTLPERGKTRQMICRGSKREFLSWLHRYGEPPRLERGALIAGTELTEEKAQELRVRPEHPLNVVS